MPITPPSSSPAPSFARLPNTPVTLETNTHSLHLGTTAQIHTDAQDESFFLPGFRLEPKKQEIPPALIGRNFQALTPDKLGASPTGEVFIRLFQEELAAQRPFLLQDKEDFARENPHLPQTHFYHNSVISKRFSFFIETASRLCQQSGLPRNVDVLKAINTAALELRNSRMVHFDHSDQSYWRQSLEWVRVFENMRDQLAAHDPRKDGLQHVIDYFYMNRHPLPANTLSTNFEETARLRVYDASNGHSVSLNAQSEKLGQKSYCVYQVPENLESHFLFRTLSRRAGLYVYRDGDKYFYEGTNEPVNPQKIPRLLIHPVGKLALRPLQTRELPRNNFFFDRAQHQVSDIGLNAPRTPDEIRALIANAGLNMSQAGELKIYEASSKTRFSFSPAMQREALMYLLDTGGTYVPAEQLDSPHLEPSRVTQVHIQRAGETQGCQLSVQTVDGKSHTFPLIVHAISKDAESEPSLSPAQAFSLIIPQEANSVSLVENPAVQITPGSQNTFLTAALTRAFRASPQQSFSFNGHGEVIRMQDSFSHSPSAKEGSLALLKSEIIDYANKRVRMHFFDPKTQELIESTVQFRSAGNGLYQAVEESSSSAVVKDSLWQRTRDATGFKSLRFEQLKANANSGVPFYIHATVDEKEYRGQIHTLSMRSVATSEDKSSERFCISVQGEFGVLELGHITHHYNGIGIIDASYDDLIPFDAYYNATSQVSPLLLQGEQQFINLPMREQGLILLGSDAGTTQQLLCTSLANVQMLSDLVRLGIENTDGKTRYLVVQADGERVVYTDEQSWQEAIKRS